jgi:cell wall-associated NlpC family hydrolase
MPVNHQGHRRALRSAATVAALTVSTAGLLAAPAHATDKKATTLTVSPYRVSKIAGQGVTFTFTLTTGTSTRLPGKTIEIYTRSPSTTTWTHSWTRTLNSSGQTSVAFTVKHSTYVVGKFLGDTTYAGDRSGGALVTATSPLGTRAVTEASHHQGQPYVYGAAGPDRFDCSGFTKYVFSRFGKTLPHNSGQQYGVVKHIAKSSAQVGDLIFLYSSSGIYHVAIYAGGGYIWHAPHSGDVVKKAKLWTSAYYVGRVS